MTMIYATIMSTMEFNVEFNRRHCSILLVNEGLSNMADYASNCR